MDWVLGRVVDQSHCGASVGNTKITDIVKMVKIDVYKERLDRGGRDHVNNHCGPRGYHAVMSLRRTSRVCHNNTPT